MIDAITISGDHSALLLASICVTFFGFFLLWLASLTTRNAAIIDCYWGPGFAVIGCVYLIAGPAFRPAGANWMQWVFLAMVVVWSARLGVHLSRRHFAAEGEDRRYAEMRRSAGDGFWWRSLITVFTLQAVLLWLVAAPVHVALLAPATAINASLFVAGVAIALVGFLIETAADQQLAAGKRTTPRDETFRSGLWRYCRHPNYFGELVFWWGMGFAAFALSANWIAFGGPALLTLLINAVSLPLTERHLSSSRKDYTAYQAEIAKIVPRGFFQP